jgi:MFS family permease
VLESPLSLLRRLPPTVLWLVAGTLINKAGSFIIPFLTLVLKREFGLSGSAAGSLVAAYGFGSIVSILVGGALTDKLGRRATLLLSLSASGVLAVAMGLAPGFREFLPLLLLFGFVADLYRPAAAAMLSDLLPSRERPVGFAALRMAVNLGFAIGMGLGGVLADAHWRLLFLFDGATTLGYCVLVLLVLPETRPQPESEPGGAAPPAAESPWRDRVFLQLAAASLLYCSLIFIALTILPLTITISAGYPAWVYGVLVGSNGLLIALFEVPLVAWLRRFRRLRVAALGTVLSGLGFGATALHLHWGWFLATGVLWTLGEILVVPQQNAFIADWAPPAARGRYLALYHATWSLGLLIAPLGFLPLHERLGDAAFWPLLTLTAIPLGSVLLRLDRVADRPELLRGASEQPAETSLATAIAAEAEG